MATRSLERGTLERHLVERAEVLATDTTGVLARTSAHRHPWPVGPFPPPPPASVEVAAAPGRVVLRTPAMTAVAALDPYRLEVRGATDGPAAPSGRAPLATVGGPDPSYFAVGDSLGTGPGRDLGDGRPVATETFGIGPGDAVYGFGETFLGLDKCGQTLDLWTSDAMGAHTPRCYKPVPFFLTTGGYGVFLHTWSRVTAWAGSRAAAQVQVAVDDDVLDYFVLLGRPADILAGYTALTGRAPVPPAWSFGWWQSRCSYASADQVLEAVRELRAAGFPLDVVHLDTNWFAVDWRCDLEFAPDWFPDPGGSAGTWPPTASTCRCGRCRTWSRAPASTTGWPAPAGSSAPATAACSTSASHSSPATTGRCTWSTGRARRRCGSWRRSTGGCSPPASVVKVDFGEELPDHAVYADGTPAERMRNQYPVRYQAAVHAATAAARGESERIAWSRSGWAGAQRFPVHWGGDVPPAWEMLLPQLHGGLSLGLSGFSFWSADIGGTGELPDDPELLVRWLQWGVLLSHPRVHGMGEREPCRWPEPARRVAGDWIRLRYRLLPYVLAEAALAASRGLPFARALVLEFPDDPATWRIGDQFLCGGSILAAPLFAPGGRRRVYLPAGTWTDWWTRERVRGPRRAGAVHGLDTMPLYLREGAVVPMGPVTRWVGERPTDPLTVVAAPFEEDGLTELAVPVDDHEVLISYRARAGRHRVEVQGHPGRVALDAPAGVELGP